MGTYSDNVQYRAQVDKHTRDVDGKYCTYSIEKVDGSEPGFTGFDIRRLSYEITWADNILIVGYTLQRLVDGATSDLQRNICQELLTTYEELIGPISGENTVVPFNSRKDNPQ